LDFRFRSCDVRRAAGCDLLVKQGKRRDFCLQMRVAPWHLPVLSCTDMRSVEIIADLEDAVGKPVILSNQAMLFEGLEIPGIPEPITGFGQLLERPRA